MKYQSIILTLILACMFVSCGPDRSARFQLLDAGKTGIDFENTIIENDSINVFEYMNIYTGAGVAVGDIDNDGLIDIYFSGNMVSGRLYRNKGGLQFEDITEKSGLLNTRWGTGATMVDINQDGYLDLYVCVSGGGRESERANMLYVNNADGTFSEKAKEYGLADTRQSMQAAFFDYDNDGDLDMYLLVNPAAYEYKVNVSKPRELNGESVNNDRLYRNEGNGRFKDVSMSAGILVEGYGLGVAVSDINGDSWPDVYVSNDFIGNDIMYINQKDGTFRDEITDHIKHTSYAGMGNDVADIDNNGAPDIMVLDMRPEDNKRQKLIISSTGYDRFQMMLQAGYNPQYSRNTLQINQGGGKFSEVGFLAGVSSTDWSWSPLLADYDNDGLKDLYVTNGFLRDLGNLDYIHYQNIYDNPLGEAQSKIARKLESIRELPKADLVNYAYRNKGDATFEKVTESWGFRESSCSNGAAFADLDNDGDLDLLVNNVNQPAFVYQNLSDLKEDNHFLRLKLKGKAGNLEGIGAKIKIAAQGNQQYHQHYLSRGYESSVDPIVHFGLGRHKKVDSLEIWWPDGTYELKRDLDANQLLVIEQADAAPFLASDEAIVRATWFRDLTDSLGIAFVHREDNLVDFKLQPILPHMHSRNGPGIAVGDLNGDALEDFYVGGAAGQSGQFFIQKSGGGFDTREGSDPKFEDMGCLFFDANGDGFNDLYVVSGGVLASQDRRAYQDRLYLNDGTGMLGISNALPEMNSSGSCVVGADYDKDGDIDLFVGGRLDPGRYPMPAKSYLLENRSNRATGDAKFGDIGDNIQGWDQLTMVTSALWTDYDNDGWTDLIVVGEFMPLTFFHNDKGQLALVGDSTGLTKTEGWWNSISGGDFDRDGDTDYILGNLGLNTKYTASTTEPLCIYAADYDKDGRIDPIMCYFVDGENHLAHSRDEIIGQISAMRSRFKSYESYAESNFEKSFLPQEIESAYIVKSYNFASSYLENLGKGRFELKSLPLEAQVAPVEGILVADFDQDGQQDVLLTGNSYATEASTGRYDAFMGLLWKGKGDGTFEKVDWKTSGFEQDSDGSGLALMYAGKGNTFVVTAGNDGPLKLFENLMIAPENQMIEVPEEAQSAEVTGIDGKRYKLEFYSGSGYLSQQSKQIPINDHIKEIKMFYNNGTSRTVYSNEAVR